MNLGKLYIVPTPIGNMGDMTFRSVDTLRLSDYILAEDTRHSKRLLAHYHIDKPLVSYHTHNEHKQAERIIEEIKEKTLQVSLISDAGTPAISDPGYLLVRRAIEKDVRVECLPGATAFTPALIVSGMPLHHFAFYGFLPQKKGRQKSLDLLSKENKTIVMYESPHRILSLIKELREIWGKEKNICVVKEISKINETIYRGSIEEVEKSLSVAPIKGEYVVVA